ncbi:hypothetical protein IEQ34_008509 [Dendrobium chrysotoxum]|uniref:Uncharacterized protein n=1 Tax=Dendrobium chrysotoxum TaxID=161865 RepID=A0AAV7GGR2_DENCH|nr:hypothetical protein IEQ34_008509 [Dendrobium chrysotoxum]
MEKEKGGFIYLTLVPGFFASYVRESWLPHFRGSWYTSLFPCNAVPCSSIPGHIHATPCVTAT